MKRFQFEISDNCTSVVLHHPLIPHLTAIISLLVSFVVPNVISIHNAKDEPIMFVLGNIIEGYHNFGFDLDVLFEAYRYSTEVMR